MHLIHTNQRPAYMVEMVELTATSSSLSGLQSASHLIYRKPALKTKQAFSQRLTVATKASSVAHLVKLSNVYLG